MTQVTAETAVTPEVPLSRAQHVCEWVMGLCSRNFEDGEGFQSLAALYVPDGDAGTPRVSILALHMFHQEHQVEVIRSEAKKVGARAIFTGSKVLLDIDPFVSPPAEKSTKALLVTGSSSGFELSLLRQIREDGSLGEMVAAENVSGRFANLFPKG